MITKHDVIEFFDNQASTWDDSQVCSREIIGTILDNAGVSAGKTVLDVACGTGVMIPFYLERGVASVTGIDISTQMANIARRKFPQENVQILCGDVEETEFSEKFDCIMIYNAFPHFPDPDGLIARLSSLLKPGGTLTVAHGASRETIDNHHSGSASKVSMGLMRAQDLADIFRRDLSVTAVLSNDKMYQVTGTMDGEACHSHGGHTHRHTHGSLEHTHTPMDELLALMKYMVSHNDAHAQELAELADQLQAAGKVHAYRKIMDTVASFDMANAQLDAVLKELTVETFE